MDLTEHVQALYLHAADGLSIAEMKYAFDEALKVCTFFPKPAELLKFAAQYRSTPGYAAYREERDRIIADRIAEPYRQRKLAGAAPAKALPPMPEDMAPAQSIREIMKTPMFQKAMGDLRMDRIALRTVSEIPAEVQKRKGPEWEAELQRQKIALEKQIADQERQQPK